MKISRRWLVDHSDWRLTVLSSETRVNEEKRRNLSRKGQMGGTPRTESEDGERVTVVQSRLLAGTAAQLTAISG